MVSFDEGNAIGLNLVRIREENVADFRRYIAEISCVDGDRHDFSCRNIGQMIFRDKSREIGDLSRYIAWSTRGQRSQRVTVKVKCATVSHYSAPPKQFAFASEGI